MAVGTALTSPEPGWKRVSSNDPNIIYSAGWVIRDAYRRYNAAQNASGSFSFYGTKVRIIGGVPDGAYGLGTAYIDGVAYPFSSFKPWDSVLVEVIGLSLGTHTVSFVNTSGSYMEVDSFDVDSDGEVVGPWFNKTKTRIADMKIGDRIPFNYNAASNSFGTISQLGSSVATDIPVASTATPNGTAYFIHCGYDSQGRIKLVADRNIQHSISWDTLNLAGIASGNGLPLSIDGKSGYTIRLLSGGVSAADKDNEWDKIIAESTLNGTIMAGNSATWNWSGSYAWTSSNPNVAGSSTVRGNSAVSAYTYAVTSWVNAAGSFRPILLVNINSNCVVKKITPTHLYARQHSSCLIEASAVLEEVSQNFKILVNGVEVSALDGSLERVIPISAFAVGNNNLIIEAVDGGNVSINIVLEAPYRTKAVRTFTKVDGEYVLNSVVLDGAAKEG